MNRGFTNKINRFLDSMVPPAVRDNKFISSIVFKMAFGKKYHYYMEFKDKLPSLSEQEINEYYDILHDTFIKRDTDLNKLCINRILTEIKQGTVLDAGGGKGYMSSALSNKSEKIKCTVYDIVTPTENERYSGIEYLNGSLTKLPFADNSFDNVICTHVLEHIKDVDIAVKELKRVCIDKLIIVLPRQREYKYTFDLHVNFFPYKYNVETLLGSNGLVELLDNDWIYISKSNKL